MPTRVGGWGAAAMGLALLCGSACAPRVSISLPGRPGTPDAEAVRRFSDATAHCARLGTWTAEIAVSGTVRQNTVRLKVLAGTTDRGDVRLEGVAPFGGPVFVLTATGGRASLLLTRESRILREVPTEDVLDALVGLPLPAVDLHRLLTGCAASVSQVDNGRALGGGWFSVDIGRGRTAYLREGQGVTRLAGARLGGLSVAYDAFEGRAPREARVVTDGPSSATARLRLSFAQVDESVDLADDAFRMDVPPAARPMSLAELRAWGHGRGPS